MISTLIFSKNRACQLDLLLRSINENFTHISNDIRIIYTYTDSEFEKGYSKLIDKFPDCIWYEQVDFQKDTMFALSQSKEHVCFFVDDNVVYNKPNIFGYQIEYLINNIEEACCFSFRLGLNTITQAPYANPPRILDIKQIPFAEILADDKQILGWLWNKLPTYGNNFGYPFSVDGHIYNTKSIIDCLDYEFDTPNALEGRFPIKKLKPAMLCLTKSCVVNNPINLVGSSNNDAGHWWGHTLEELNTNFIKGKIINLASIYKNKIVGSHQEMEIELI